MNAVLNYIINMQNGTFGAGVNQASAQIDRLDGMVNKVGLTLASAFSVQKILSLADETTQIATKFDQLNNKIDFSSGKKAAVNMAFLKDTINSLKLPLESTTEGYANYLGVIKGTNLEGQKGNVIFGDIVTGFKGARLSVEQQERAMGALYKMISTGNVQADEFKQQFAEAIPGAMALAEKATGMTMQQFTKEMEKGNINSIQFIEQFSKVMRQEYEQNLPAALRGFDSKINQATNSILLQKIALGDNLMPVQLAWLNLQETGFGILNQSLIFYRENETLINALAVAFLSGVAAYYLMITANKLYIGWQAITYTWGLLQLGLAEANTLGLTGWAAAQHALNIAMAANPIGAVIIAIAALVGFLIYAWTHSEKFRAIMMGVWEVLKSVGEIIGRLVVLPIQLALDPRGALDSVKRIKDLASGLGTDFKAAYNTEINQSKLSAGNKQPSPIEKAAAAAGTGSKAAKPKLNSGGTSGKAETSAGSRQVRNVILNFKSAIGEVKITSAKIEQLSQTELKKILTDIIVSAAHDAEVTIANN